jgi:hypothetical protein
MSKTVVLKLLPFVACLPFALGALKVETLTAARAAPPPPQQPPAPAAPKVDPNAVALLNQSIEKMKSLQTFSIHAVATRDNVVGNDFKVQKDMTEDVIVQKPDRMRAEVSGDEGGRLFVYDGKSVSILASPEHSSASYYATIPAPPTIRATLDEVAPRYRVDLPLTDLLYMASGGSPGENATAAGVIGESRVEGAECDHLAFRGKNVDWQVWIERGSLLPRKVAVTTRDAPAAPEYVAVLSWNTSPAITESHFKFEPPSGALPMSVGTADEGKSSPKPGK